MKKEELVSIQFLRAVAALMVVFYHVYVIGRQYWPVNYWEPIAKSGMLGVNLFFVLSGFIILKAHWSDIGVPKKFPRYLFRRFTKIYPLYWVLTIAYVAAAQMGVGTPDFTTDTPNIFSAATLIEFTPDVHLPLQVAWTLFFEIKFYLLFGLLIFNRGLGLAVLFAHLAYIIASQYLGWADMFKLGSLWFIHFFFGMLAFICPRKASKRWVGSLAVLAFAAIVWFVAKYNYGMGDLQKNEYFLWMLAPAFTLILLFVVMLEDKIKLWAPAWLKLLGDASYSIYLAHSAVISAVFIIAKKAGLLVTVPYSLMYLSCFIASVCVGVGIYLLLEKPLLSSIRRLRF